MTVKNIKDLRPLDSKFVLSEEDQLKIGIKPPKPFTNGLTFQSAYFNKTENN